MAKMCKSCGTVVDDNVTNCPNCGAVVEAAMPQQPVQQPVQQPAPGQQPNYQQPQQPQQAIPGQKSKLVAGLLGIFVGGLGIHQFYLGNTGKGVRDLLLSLLCGIGAIVGLIEGIMILTGSINTDANGVPLGD